MTSRRSTAEGMPKRVLLYHFNQAATRCRRPFLVNDRFAIQLERDSSIEVKRRA